MDVSGVSVGGVNVEDTDGIGGVPPYRADPHAETLHVPADLLGAGAAHAPGGDGRCPKCGTQPERGHRFCEACGYDLRAAAAPVPERVPPRRGPAAAVCGSCRTPTIGPDGWCETCGRAFNPRDLRRVDLRVAAGVSDRGHRHRRNEDAMAVEVVTGHDGRPAVAAVVCDGVSSSPRPDEASAVAADTACQALGGALRGGAHPEQAMRAAVAAAAGAVARMGGRAGESNAPACTIVAAAVTTDLVTVGWVGDSRAYWLAAPDPDEPEFDPDDTLPGGPGRHTARLLPVGIADETVAAATPSALLTEDDSWAVRMVALGEMTEEQAYADRRAHAIVAWLGADAGVVRPRVTSFRPSGPGAVLLCSDGLWNYLQAAATLAAFALPAGLTDPLRQAQALTDYALGRGGADNITVVLVPFPPGRHAGPAAREENSR